MLCHGEIRKEAERVQTPLDVPIFIMIEILGPKETPSRWETIVVGKAISVINQVICQFPDHVFNPVFLRFGLSD